MSIDKRNVSTDALETLGTIIGENEKRDAIHLAVEPVIAGNDLRPGDHVGIIGGKAYLTTINPIGIVDPFIKRGILQGERFWLVIYPRKITSLRHVWSHPDLPDTEDIIPSHIDKEISEKWLRDFCEHNDVPVYYQMLDGAINNEDDEYLTFYNGPGSGTIPPELWMHVENVTGKKIPSEHRAKYFACTC